MSAASRSATWSTPPARKKCQWYDAVAIRSSSSRRLEARRLAQDALGDDDALDLRRAFEDVEDLDVTVPLLDKARALEAMGAEDLHRLLADAHRRARRVGLGH